MNLTSRFADEMRYQNPVRSPVATMKYQEALDAFETCLRLRLATLSEEHWLVSTTKSFIGECLVPLGEREAGRRLLRESFESLTGRLGPKHEQTLEARDRMLAAERL